MTSEQQQQNSLDNYRALLKERGELHLFRKQCDDRIKQLDEDLRPALEGRGEVVAEGFAFKCALTKGRKSIDKDLLEDFLKKHSLAVADFEKEGAPFTTMTVKAVTTI